MFNRIPKTVYSHILYSIGLVLLCVGCIFFFNEGEHGVKDLFHFLPSGLSFLVGMFISVVNPEHMGWLSQVDPLTGLFLMITTIFAVCGLMLFIFGNAKAGELVLQISTASFSFLGGLEAGMIRQRAKMRNSRARPRKTAGTQERTGA